jgi:hypothetical protein
VGYNFREIGLAAGRLAADLLEGTDPRTRIMSRAVSGVRIVARSCRNSARNRASIGRAPSCSPGLLASAWRAWR